MHFDHLPPGTQGKGEADPGRPSPTGGRTRPATPAAPGPARQGLSIAMFWFGCLVPLSLITQIWAGSRFSPGQGGGLKELLAWVVVFGAAAITLVVWRAGEVEDRDWSEPAIVGAALGFVVGAVVAIGWFTAKGGPSTGDWFVGPAAASAGVALAVLIASMRP